jgi:hypothetical protein
MDVDPLDEDLIARAMPCGNLSYHETFLINANPVQTNWVEVCTIWALRGFGGFRAVQDRGSVLPIARATLAILRA